jgi:hypothetical protein
LLAFALMPYVTAASDPNVIGVMIQTDGHYEMPMEVNCEWGFVTWLEGETFPPPPGSPWTLEVVSVTVPNNMIVDIYMTDVLLKGDIMELYEINGMTPTYARLIGITPWVPQGPSPDPTATGDSDVAWNDPSYSHGKFTWALTAGTHYFAVKGAPGSWPIASVCIKFCPGTAVPPVGGNLLPGSSSIISVVTLVGTIGAIAVVVGSRKKRAF